MRLVRLALTALLALPIASTAGAACGDQPGDAGAVAMARALAATRCDCATAPSHGQHVRCVGAVAREALRARTLPERCVAQVVRCAARSTCGRPGAVTCCRTDAAGATRCRVKRSAAGCWPPRGGSACVGTEASCCDSCTTGCLPVTTTTTLPPARPCARNGECDDGNPCSQDECQGGICRHECLCVGPGAIFTCCPGPAAECDAPLRWFETCGDPVCGEHRDQPGVPPCGGGQTSGAACSAEGATCDPGDSCNALLLCARTDPTHGGRCPISRRTAKDDIRYLAEPDLRRLHDELMRFPLATWRYHDEASGRRLGFMIDDVEPSDAVAPGGQRVDVYAYTTMAVAALQSQAREIQSLKRELAALREERCAASRVRGRPRAK